METKKYILSLLEKLQDMWLLAMPLHALILEDGLDEISLQSIAELLTQSIQETEQETYKNRLEQAIYIIHQLQEKETQGSIDADNELEASIARL